MKKEKGNIFLTSTICFIILTALLALIPNKTGLQDRPKPVSKEEMTKVLNKHLDAFNYIKDEALDSNYDLDLNLLKSSWQEPNEYLKTNKPVKVNLLMQYFRLCQTGKIERIYESDGMVVFEKYCGMYHIEGSSQINRYWVKLIYSKSGYEGSRVLPRDSHIQGNWYYCVDSWPINEI